MCISCFVIGANTELIISHSAADKTRSSFQEICDFLLQLGCSSLSIVSVFLAMGNCFSSSGVSTNDPSTASSIPSASMSALKRKSSRNLSAKWATTAADILPGCEPVRLLGEGTFGTVVLVRERSTHEYFAVKVMNKSQLVYEDQLDNIILERQVLREAGPHPFVVECHSGFQTSDAVVLVLEYVPGGDMYDLLKRHGCLTEDDARFYLAEIVVALAELHRHNFVFRDLKLENILIDAEGHVRLTDFGLAGKVAITGGSESLIFDISGTAIYQAPEMLNGKGHGRVVDWWALGVLSYVLLAGRPPFASDSREKLHESILTEQLDLANDSRLEHVSDIGKAFINRLLDKNPETRLGSAGADAEDVQSDPFFSQIHWTAVSHAEVSPPLAPGLQPSDNGTNPNDVKLAHRKLADKVLRKHKPNRTASERLKKDLDAGEYKMVTVARNGADSRRVSIGLDFGGKNQKAAGKTWTDTADDFGRILST